MAEENVSRLVYNDLHTPSFGRRGIDYLIYADPRGPHQISGGNGDVNLGAFVERLLANTDVTTLTPKILMVSSNDESHPSSEEESDGNSLVTFTDDKMRALISAMSVVSDDDEEESNGVNSAKPNDMHIDIIVEQVDGITREQATESLIRCNGDVIDAILDLSCPSPEKIKKLR